MNSKHHTTPNMSKLTNLIQTSGLYTGSSSRGLHLVNHFRSLWRKWSYLFGCFDWMFPNLYLGNHHFHPLNSWLFWWFPGFDPIFSGVKSSQSSTPRNTSVAHIELATGRRWSPSFNMGTSPPWEWWSSKSTILWLCVYLFLGKFWNKPMEMYSIQQKRTSLLGENVFVPLRRGTKTTVSELHENQS